MEIERFLESQEGLIYKEQLLKQLQQEEKLNSKFRKRKANDFDEKSDSFDSLPKRRSTRSYTIDSCDSKTSDEESQLELNCLKDDSSTAVQNLESKLLGLQKDVDDFPGRWPKLMLK